MDVYGGGCWMGCESEWGKIFGMLLLYWQLENWSALSFWMVEWIWG